MRGRQKLALAAAAVVALVLIIAIFSLGRSRKPLPPPVVAIPGGEPAEETKRRERVAEAASVPATQQPPRRTVTATGIAAEDVSATPEQRFRRRMEETRQALLSKHKYPDESQPLATKSDLLLPHHVEPVFRGLGGMTPQGAARGAQPGKVQITQHQDRLYLMPGQNAVASFTAVSGTTPSPINITRSELVREGASGTPGTVLSSVTFLDDGKPPDEIASDGTWTATVVTPNDGVASGLTLFLDLDSDGEKGTLSFPFIQTASPPGKFTQTARAALEAGSVAFYVGVSLQRAGLYEIIARLYDSNGAPVAYLRFLGQLTTDVTEVRMLAFGRLLLDEGAVPPLLLRDVEGHRMVLGQYPDREVMEEWPGGFKTEAYDIHSFSSADYVDPQKQSQLDALDKATKDGVANINGANSGGLPRRSLRPRPHLETTVSSPVMIRFTHVRESSGRTC